MRFKDVIIFFWEFFIIFGLGYLEVFCGYFFKVVNVVICIFVCVFDRRSRFFVSYARFLVGILVGFGVCCGGSERIELVTLGFFRFGLNILINV